MVTRALGATRGAPGLAVLSSRRPDGDRSSPRSPFSRLAAAAAIIATYAIACAVWVVAGGALPGNRWMAVHLFTLGVITNAVVAFTSHFGPTLTRQPGGRTHEELAALNLGVVALLVGLPTGRTWMVAVGGTLTTAMVLVGYARLRRQRRAAVGARFSFVVRIYERAHGAFVHGAILGILMGTGLLTGAWYGSARVAHLHVNVAGWAGLTFLATVVFFGPTIVRARILPGADESSAPALRRAATAITVAPLALLASGLGGPVGTGLRVLAGVALAGYAVSASRVLVPVLRVTSTAHTLSGTLVASACGWFLLAAWADVVVVTTGAWQLLDAVGLAMLLGALTQAIMATLTYVLPLLHDTAVRDRVRHRVEGWPILRATVLQTGVCAAVLSAAAAPWIGAAGAVTARIGWAAVLAVLASQLLLALRPART